METGRNTKQKQLILETLRKEKNHPTIADLYEKILEIDDTVGQATVYRNVNKLVDEGKIKRITTDCGYRYDCDCNAHYHLVCKKCNNIIDIFDEKYNKMIHRLEEEYSVKIDDSTVVFDGVCDKCLNKDTN